MSEFEQTEEEDPNPLGLELEASEKQYREAARMPKKVPNFLDFRYDSDSDADDTIEDIINRGSSKDKLKNENAIYCISCNLETIIYDPDAGAMVCYSCGTDNGLVTNNTDEWKECNSGKTYTRDDDRCNDYVANDLPNTRPQMRLSGIGQYSLLNKMHVWSSGNHKNKMMMKTYNYINNHCKERLSQKQIKDIFALYKQIYEVVNNRGPIRTGIIVACVDKICEKEGIHINIEEWADIFGMERRKALDCRKLVRNIIYTEHLDGVGTNTFGMDDYIEKFSDQLNLSDEYRRYVTYFVNELEKKRLVIENTPITKVTSCIFLVSCIFGLDISKKTISNICNTKKKIVSEVTIYKCYTKLLENIDKLIDVKTLNDDCQKNIETLRAKRYKRRKTKK